MRKYNVRRDNLTKRILDLARQKNIGTTSRKLTSFVRSNPIPVKSYEELVIEIAELSYLNPDYVLFFRGQKENYVAEKKATLYPSIYRGDYVSKVEMNYRFEVLENSCKVLVNRLNDPRIDKKIVKEFKKVKKMQWSILQHYEVCETPLLDVTQSLNVACSFALNDNTGDGYIYVLSLPYINGRISVDSEDDITNIRLLSICPHQAKRPFFQEGYLVGTEFISNDYDDKNELDFNNRLIAIYKLVNSKDFWQSTKSKNNYTNIDNKLLYPSDDVFRDICGDIIKTDAIKQTVKDAFLSKYMINIMKIENMYSNLIDKTDFERTILEYLELKNINYKSLFSIFQITRREIVDEERRGKIDLEKLKNEITLQEKLLSLVE
jgi:hypothetical protein